MRKVDFPIGQFDTDKKYEASAFRMPQWNPVKI